MLRIAAVVESDAGSYDCVVETACGTVLSEPAILTVQTPPTVVLDPESQTKSVGQSVTFCVAGNGVPAPTYQWRKNAAPIAGATDACYAIDPLGLPNAGIYDCVISNNCGTATSAAATLAVNGCLGDLNCDGRVDFHDIDPFVLALSGHGLYVTQFPDCDRDLADDNCDGYVDFRDIDPFVERLGQPCALCDGSA